MYPMLQSNSSGRSDGWGSQQTLHYNKKHLKTSRLFQESRDDQPIRYHLVHDLLYPYNPIVRPVYDPHTVTQLEMQLYVSQVLEMVLEMLWEDEMLSWNESEYGGTRSLKIPSDLIWLPEVVLYNNADDKYDSFVKEQIAVIYSNGDVMWAAPVIFLSNCQVDVTYFPFDSQQCQLKFGPWQYDGNELKVNGTGDASVFTSDGEWDMLGLIATSNVEYYPDHPGVPYYDVTYTLYIRRRPVYFIFNLIVPCVILAALSSLTFLLPPESGEKISYGISVLLALTVFLLLMAESLPPSSVIPLVGQYHAATVVLVTMSLITSVIVINTHHRGGAGDPLPPWMRRFILGYMSKIVFFKYKDLRQPRSRKLNLNSGRSPSCLRYIECNNDRQSNGVSNNPDNKGQQMSQRDSPTMRLLVKEVRKIATFLEDNKKDDEMKHEWMTAAVVLDRFFLMLYICASISTVLVIAARVDWTSML
uniref:Neuronal acetylcholine receptor subunit alpha-10-like n=1 Tax=Saccoglossus kowalevskii TaxID=10224 RepID=A0ABM0GRM6_SACKO